MMLCSAGTMTVPLPRRMSSTHRCTKFTWEKVAVPCKHCQEVDHSDAECTIAAILPKPLPPPASSLSSQRADRSTMGKGKRPAHYNRQRPFCTSWNTGQCITHFMLTAVISLLEMASLSSASTSFTAYTTFPQLLSLQKA